MTAVIYARYSSDDQREESIEGQIREYTAYCTLRRQLSKRLSLFFCVRPFGNALSTRIRGLEQHGPAAGGATKAPVGLLLACGS
jgi:predicted site-specific integrase-resolvase